MKSPELKEYEWREKRRGKITASVLPDLMQAGRGKIFGTKAIEAMFAIRYERRTGIVRESTSSKAMDWGNQNEPLAVEWLRSQFMQHIESCSHDCEDIVFNEPLPGFGDSPDAYMYDFEGVRDAVIEIKCPISQSKIEALQLLKSVTKDTEYYWQFIGHFIGSPDVDTLYCAIYDAYRNRGQILEMKRADHVEAIQEATERIRLCNEVIDESLRSGRDFESCVDKAQKVLVMRMQIESLKTGAKGSVPVQNEIYRLKRELKRLINNN